jgi:hypothetical protein
MTSTANNDVPAAGGYDISDLHDHERWDAAIDALDDGDLLLATVALVSRPLGPGVEHDTACLDVALYGMRAKTPAGAAAIFRHGLTRLKAKTVLEYAAQHTGWRFPVRDLRRAVNHASAAAHVGTFPNGQELLAAVVANACDRSAQTAGDDTYHAATIRQDAATDVRRVAEYIEAPSVLLDVLASGQDLASSAVLDRLVELVGPEQALQELGECFGPDGPPHDTQLAWVLGSLRRRLQPSA